MKISFFTFLITFFVLVSCQERKEGPIGQATIKGKIYALDYNGSFSKINDEYYIAKEDVFIVYGDEEIYGDNMETHHDGSYAFTNLAEGTYTIYAYTEDTTLITSNLLPVMKTVEITVKDEVVVVEDIVIAK